MGKRVLDLGCCQGFWSFKAIEAGAEYCLGLDSSEIFIKEAQALATLLEYKNCEFRIAHLEEDLWWREIEPFHITLFLGLFYHLADPLYVFRQAAKYTLETMVIDTEIVPREDPTLTLVHRDLAEPTTCKSNISSRLRVVPTRKALHELLRDGGFTDIRFLQPSEDMLPEYRSGHRISVIAQKTRQGRSDLDG